MSDPQEDAIRALYRQSRTEQPSQLMDRRIRKAASRALYRNRKRWLWALSTAAVMLLSFNVVLNLLDMEPDWGDLLWEQKADKLNGTTKQQGNAEPEALAQSHPDVESFRAAAKQRSMNAAVEKAKPTASGVQEMPLESLSSLAAEPGRMEKKEALSMDSALSHMPAVADSLSHKVVIPELPVVLETLLALDQSLSGEKDGDGSIHLYAGHTLILSLSPSAHVDTFNAWRGSEVIGIQLDWDLTPLKLGDCEDQQTSLVCTISDRVKGVFNNNRLESIRWQVIHE